MEFLRARTAYEMKEGARGERAVRPENCQPMGISGGAAVSGEEEFSKIRSGIEIETNKMKQGTTASSASFSEIL